MSRTGILCALVSALLFGMSVPLAKGLVGAIDPWMLAGWLYLGAGAGLGFVQGARRLSGRPAADAPLRRRSMLALAGVVVIGGMVAPVLAMQGLARTDAASASLLLNLEIVATMALAWTLGRESVDGRLFLGALALLAGAIVLGGIASPELRWGALLIALACACWAVDNLLTRSLSSHDPVAIAMAKGLAAGASNVGLAWASGVPLPAVEAATGAMLVGFVGYGASLALFVIALRHLGSARTAAYFSTAPFIGALVAVIGFGAQASMGLAIAGALMALGVFLHATERHDHRHEHPMQVHEHPHVHDDHHRHEHTEGERVGEPHSHAHRHAHLVHRHPHLPDLHHRHDHGARRSD